MTDVVRVGIAVAGHRACDVCGNLVAQGHVRVHALTDQGSRFFHLDCVLKARPDLARAGLLYRHTDVALLRAELATVEAFAPALAVEVRDVVERDAYAHSLHAPVVVKPLGADPTVAGLLAQLEAKPDDREAIAVLGDVLLANEDPRGELIALQLELARATPPLDAALCGRRDQLCDAMLPRHAQSHSVTWGVGFVRSLSLRVTDNDLPALVETLRDDSCRLLDSMSLRIAGGCRVDRLHAVLPATLRKLHAYGDLASLPQLVAATPHLDLLALEGHGWDGQLEHPRLFSLRLAGCVGDVLATLTPAQVPKLTQLTVARMRTDGPAVDVVADVVRSPLLPTLARLVIEVGVLEAHHIDALVAAQPKLRALRVVADRVPAETEARLAALARRVHVMLRRTHRQT